jgi:hypothetical protein
MARAHEDSRTLRFSRGETARVIVALLLSALLHLGIWAGYHTGHRLGWWQKFQPLSWLHLKEKKFPLQARMAHEEEPTIFVDVSHADADAPERSKYYSNKNSRAANAEVANSSAPKINGRQKDMPKTEDVPRAAKRTQETTPNTPKEVAKETTKPDNAQQMSQLQPSMPPPSPAPMPQADAPEPPQTPGETDLPRPRKTVSPQPPTTTPTTMAQAQPARPRTLKQALAQRDQIPGQQMQQDGGVARHAFTSSLDAKATPFGDYDAAIIEAVSQRWYDLLDSRRFAEDRTGKVTLRFKLKTDGSVIEMQTLENTVGELLGYLCQESIEEAAPFAKWPPDMVRMIGANYREVTFTFYYY